MSCQFQIDGDGKIKELEQTAKDPGAGCATVEASSSTTDYDKIREQIRMNVVIGSAEEDGVKVTRKGKRELSEVDRTLLIKVWYCVDVDESIVWLCFKYLLGI